MTNLTRRKYSRYSDQVPIFFAEFNSENYKQGILHNICLDGMYFESNSHLQSKNDLYIKASGHRLKGFDFDPYKAFRAKVKWSRQMAGDERHRYGFGVQFTAKSHLSYGINIQNSDYSCDYCEKIVTDIRIHQTETGLLLCPSCLNYMETLPSFIEKSLERRLLGNVV
jgi:hypothetical protein